MPDWRTLVSKRLNHTGLSTEAHEAVVTELADHLQDIYETLLADGATEAQAFERAWLEIGDGRQLSLRIFAAKHEEFGMNQRTRSFWIPGLVTLTASMVWMMFLQQHNYSMNGPWAHSGLPVAPYLLWLVAQPLFGGVAAYLSRRAGGEREACLAASLLPSIAMFALVGSVIVFGIFVERNPHILQQPINVMLTFLTWIVLPGIASLAGGIVIQKSGGPLRKAAATQGQKVE